MRYLLHAVPVRDTHGRLRVPYNYSAFNLFRNAVKFKVTLVYIMKVYGRVLDMAPRILVRSNRYRLVHLKPGRFISLEKNPLLQQNKKRECWAQTRSGSSEKKKKILPFPGIEAPLLGFQASSLVTVLIALSRLLRISNMQKGN